jgi:hypothetical protein
LDGISVYENDDAVPDDSIPEILEIQWALLSTHAVDDMALNELKINSNFVHKLF